MRSASTAGWASRNEIARRQSAIWPPRIDVLPRLAATVTPAAVIVQEYDETGLNESSRERLEVVHPRAGKAVRHSDRRVRPVANGYVQPSRQFDAALSGDGD